VLRRSPKLHRCPVCGSESVFEWAADALGDEFRSRVTLTCAECETTRVLVATTWAVDAYSRRHERQRFQIALALRDAERERMSGDVHVLAEALRHDLIGPDDFRAPGARPPSIPGTAPSRGPSGGDGG
jgi:transcription elongation factor Elf1